MRWHVEIALDVRDEPAQLEFDEATATRFQLEIYAEEWGFLFCHAGLLSRIRINNIAFVHGRDDYRLLGSMPPLAQIGSLVRELEQRHGIAFRREHALVLTDLAGAEPAIRAWLRTL